MGKALETAQGLIHPKGGFKDDFPAQFLREARLTRDAELGGKLGVNEGYGREYTVL